MVTSSLKKKTCANSALVWSLFTSVLMGRTYWMWTGKTVQLEMTAAPSLPCPPHPHPRKSCCPDCLKSETATGQWLLMGLATVLLKPSIQVPLVPRPLQHAVSRLQTRPGSWRHTGQLHSLFLILWGTEAQPFLFWFFPVGSLAFYNLGDSRWEGAKGPTWAHPSSSKRSQGTEHWHSFLHRDVFTSVLLSLRYSSLWVSQKRSVVTSGEGYRHSWFLALMPSK